jgi:hypothetical protein
MLYQTIASQQKTNSGDLISGFVKHGIVLSTSDVTIGSFYWVRPYLSEKFPTITCDRKYIWLMSTDHANENNGAIIEGKGDNLDLSDFEQIGTIYSGNQSETPCLMNIPLSPDNEKVHFFYHTGNHPNNEGIQQTRLLTTEGGSILSNCNFTDHDNPLGRFAYENHTGYFEGYFIDNKILAVHTSMANNPTKPGVIYISESFDGRQFRRVEKFDRFSAVNPGRGIVPAFGQYFKRYGRWWWLGMTYSTNFSNPDSLDKHLVLCKATNRLQIHQQCEILSTGMSHLYPYIEGDTAHVYYKEDVEAVKYGTYNLNNLIKHLINVH